MAATIHRRWPPLRPGNLAPGIYIADASATGNLVQGNYIGTDASGSAALPNELGILILGNENTIGGTEPLAANVISGNTYHGIGFDAGATANVIFGNLIGTDATGTTTLGNGDRGIFIENASNNTVGSRAPGAGNVISGNFGGIRIEGDAHGNTVRGNLIGTDRSGTVPLGNARGGIVMRAGPSNNWIGGRRAGSGNLIAYSGRAGIRISPTAGAGNAVLGNAVVANGGLGIDIASGDVTPNEPGRAQNFPVLDWASGSSVTVSGTLNSTPETEFRIEFFANTACDPTGYGEGETFLGYTTVTTDGLGDTSFTVTLPVSLPVGTYITATATDAAYNTSEFSACVATS